MRKASWKARISLLLTGLFLTMTACAKEQEESGTEPVSDASREIRMTTYAPILEADALTAEDPENPAGRIQNQCVCAMVRIQAGNLIGSGVIFDAGTDGLRIATAAHVLANGDGTAKITFDDGYEVTCDKIKQSEKQDLAILEIPRDALLEKNGADDAIDHGEKIKRAKFSKEAYDGTANGDLVIALGSRTGVGEDAYAGCILQDYAYFEDFDAYMMLADVMVTPGMSGGGLFDAEGNLLGILCGTSEDGEVAVAPMLGLLAMD
ncbi:MAG: serine protease [Acetatifactor sp.]|nr:serine protease [Acetatifactor sp.]